MAAKIFRQMFEEKYMRFPGGLAKAVTLSYDDGVHADKKLMQIIDKYGLKCTFNLNSTLFDCVNWHNRMDEEETYLTFGDTPHEIALHGARHIFLNKVPLPEAVREVAFNRDWLEHKFGRIVNGMAYAYNGYNADVKRVIADLGVQYARTTHSTYSFALPEDFLEWNPTCHHTEYERLRELTGRFTQQTPLAEFKDREPWLFYLWGHSYEYDDNADWDVLEDFCAAVAGAEGVWFATNGEVCAYIKAWRSLIWSLDGERAFNPSYMPVWLEIRGKIYRIPAGGTVKFEEE